MMARAVLFSVTREKTFHARSLLAAPLISCARYSSPKRRYESRTGNLSVHDNTYISVSMTIDNETAGVPRIMLEYEDMDNMPTNQGNGYYLKNCTIENARFIISATETEIDFVDCTFVGTSRGLHFAYDGPDVTVTETNCPGTPTRYGPYTDREL